MEPDRSRHARSRAQWERLRALTEVSDEALDRLMEMLPAEAASQLPRRRQEPAAHRGDHLDEIDRVLAR